jgi:hypothetical protein
LFLFSEIKEQREREQANPVATGGLRDQQEPTNASLLLFDVDASSGRWVVRAESINWPGPRCVSMTGRPHSAQVVGPFKLALAPLCFASRKFRVQSFGSTLFFLTLCSSTLLTFLLFFFFDRCQPEQIGCSLHEISGGCGIAIQDQQPPAGRTARSGRKFAGRQFRGPHSLFFLLIIAVVVAVVDGSFSDDQRHGSHRSTGQHGLSSLRSYQSGRRSGKSFKPNILKSVKV